MAEACGAPRAWGPVHSSGTLTVSIAGGPPAQATGRPPHASHPVAAYRSP
jgi:hypothetical protein